MYFNRITRSPCRRLLTRIPPSFLLSFPQQQRRQMQLPELLQQWRQQQTCLDPTNKQFQCSNRCNQLCIKKHYIILRLLCSDCVFTRYFNHDLDVSVGSAISSSDTWTKIFRRVTFSSFHSYLRN